MLDEENTTFPVLPLRDIVVFPHMIVPLFVGREKSVKALEEVMKDNKQILLSSQIDPSEDQPTEDSIFKTGVLANVLQLLKLPDGTVKVLVEGQTRVLITNFLENKSFFEAQCEEIEETLGDEKANVALVKTVSQEFDRYAKVKKKYSRRCYHNNCRYQRSSKIIRFGVWSSWDRGRPKARSSGGHYLLVNG